MVQQSPCLRESMHHCLGLVCYIQRTHNPAVVAEDLSKCYIHEVEKPQMESTVAPMSRVPLQVPQRFQGAASVARPGKVVRSVLRYNNNGANAAAAAAEQLYEQQRRSIRNPAGIPSQYSTVASSGGGSYPRRNLSAGKIDSRGDNEVVEGPSSIVLPQHWAPPYVGAVTRKVAAVAHGRLSTPW